MQYWFQMKFACFRSVRAYIALVCEGITKHKQLPSCSRKIWKSFRQMSTPGFPHPLPYFWPCFPRPSDWLAYWAKHQVKSVERGSWRDEQAELSGWLGGLVMDSKGSGSEGHAIGRTCVLDTTSPYNNNKHHWVEQSDAATEHNGNFKYGKYISTRNAEIIGLKQS